MRRELILIASVGLVACVSTTLETPSDHLARPPAAPEPRQSPAAALSSGFDPFAAYPEVAKATDPGAKPLSDATQAFTCPMHDQVVRDAPGACPICGMKLVPKKPTSAHPGH